MLDDNEVHSLKIKGNDGKVKFIDITKTDVKELLTVVHTVCNIYCLFYKHKENALENKYK